MIEYVEVKNYKMLHYVNIKHFAQINILVGKNNCGKTSLLEAIFLSLESRAETIVTIFNAIRQIPISDKIFFYLFYQLDVNNPIELKLSLKNTEAIQSIKSLRIESIMPYETKIIQHASQINTYKNFTKKEANILQIKSAIADKWEIIDELKIQDNEILSHSPNISTEFALPALFISSLVNVNLPLLIGRIRVDKKEAILQKYVQIFDYNIQDVEVIDYQVYIDLQDMPQKVPMNVMGEGFKKFLAIVASLIVNETRYLLIDEIENGLHFQTIQKLIKAIFKLSSETNMQCFITTHSYEFLKILSQVAYEMPYEDIAIFNLATTKLKGLQAYRYDQSDLHQLLENEIEFRD